MIACWLLGASFLRYRAASAIVSYMMENPPGAFSWPGGGVWFASAEKALPIPLVATRMIAAEKIKKMQGMRVFIRTIMISLTKIALSDEPQWPIAQSLTLISFKCIPVASEGHPLQKQSVKTEHSESLK